MPSDQESRRRVRHILEQDVSQVAKGKNEPKNWSEEMSCFEVQGCSLLRAESFSYSLNVLKRGIGIKNESWRRIFFRCKILQFLFIKISDPDPQESNADPQHYALIPTYIQQGLHTDADHGVDADRTSWQQ